MTLASGAFHRSERNTPTRTTSASTIDPHKGDDVMANHPAGSEPRTGTAAFDAGSGEMPSWSELVSEHADGVYRLALRLSGNTHDAEDLTQETFMRVFRSLKRYKPGTFEGWLHRITTNLFLDMVRRRQTIRMEALPENYDAVPGTRNDPEQSYIDANIDPELQKALDSLPTDYRVAVVLCDVVGMSYDEIADTLGIKMGTVRSRIHRGRAQLRKSLQSSEGILHYVG
ncbi:RNA polymerase sigma factor SigE [Corynebacterium pseudokroppenstedtii]|uniref:RNA polymerase sigma factor SigE n=1 Tax=Corynebacterium pseudokroppenstedtii TaxID=2804917 RepID=UPI001D28C96A|nr:RNA polymerase sigma factor SigE [Corynebacterium kroppenstedtii]